MRVERRPGGHSQVECGEHVPAVCVHLKLAALTFAAVQQLVLTLVVIQVTI